ncbi:MAG: hypothetical protein EBY80_14170, partial [Actinobacteria bacterium]|nr:hypothetical protein [Actinomycetota bacterium]
MRTTRQVLPVYARETTVPSPAAESRSDSGVHPTPLKNSAMPLLDRRSGLRALDQTPSSARLRQLTRFSAGLCLIAIVALILLIVVLVLAFGGS